MINVLIRVMLPVKVWLTITRWPHVDIEDECYRSTTLGAWFFSKNDRVKREFPPGVVAYLWSYRGVGFRNYKSIHLTILVLQSSNKSCNHRTPEKIRATSRRLAARFSIEKEGEEEDTDRTVDVVVMVVYGPIGMVGEQDFFEGERQLLVRWVGQTIERVLADKKDCRLILGGYQ